MDLKLIAKKNNWKIKKLDKVTFFQEGPGVRNHQYTKNGVKLLNVANLFDGQLDLSRSDRFISEDEAYGKYSHFLADEGDLIIACSGIQVDYFHKKMGFVKKEHLPLCMNTSTMRFKVLDDNILDLNYLAYYLKTDFFKNQIQRLITGSAQLNFGPSHIKKIDILIPSLETQKKIVKVLDKAQGLIDARKEQIKLMDELIQSVFYEMFGDPVTNPKGWEVGTINDLTLKTQYGTSEKAHETDGEYPVLRMNNITYNGGWDFSSLKYVDLDESDLEKYLVYKGELLFNRTNSKELVGKTAVYRETKPMAYAGYLVKLKTNSSGNTEYISAYLNSQHGKSTLLNMAKSIVGMANINAEELKKIKINLPPIEVQNQFADIVSKIEKERSKLTNSIKDYNDIYVSIVQKTFSGKLI